MLDWRGEQVRDHVVLAAGRAINRTLSECVIEAKSVVQKRTTVLQGSIQMRPAVQMDQTHVVGYWGSFAVHYAIYVEKGTRPHFPPVQAIAEGMRVTPEVAFLIARSISRKGTKAYPYLERTAEKIYPKLAGYIREALEAAG